jgi:hypothetical protein
VVIDMDCIGSYKSNYHTSMVMTAMRYSKTYFEWMKNMSD